MSLMGESSKASIWNWKSKNTTYENYWNKQASFFTNAVTSNRLWNRNFWTSSSYSLNSEFNAVLPKQGAIALFSDSIPKRMNIKSINKQVKGGHIYIKVFKEARLTQLSTFTFTSTWRIWLWCSYHACRN